MPTQPLKILIADDDDAMTEVLRMRLEAWGHEVSAARDGAEAERRVESFAPDLVLSDVAMPGLTGTELVERLRARSPALPVLLMTSHGSIDSAVEAMKLGARDFLTKPLDYRQLESLLEEMGRELESRRASSRLASQLEGEGRFGDLVGASAPMLQVYELIREVAPSGAAVLVTGESGTGKELVARTLHRLSSRRDQAFVAVNAAAIPRELMESEIFGHEKGAFTGATGTRQGCFELAHRGTLFLDEIGEMPLELQPKLLRVLEDGRVRRLGGREEHAFDVRLVAATNREPQRAVEDGKLREDLLYRLNVFTLEMPPLRARLDDLPLLAQHFLAELAVKHGGEARALRDETLEVMRGYAWPGNVRELRNVVERAVVLAKGEWIEPQHLPPYVRRPEPGAVAGETVELPAGVTLAEAEKTLILRTLEETGNNKVEAARRLGVAAKTIYNKLKAYGSD